MFSLTDVNGTGWAESAYGQFSFQLPGEPNATYGVPYATQVVSTSGSTYLVNGSFAGGDVNTGKIVEGVTSTYISVVTVCARVCGTSYKLDNGTISVTPTNLDATNTSISCVPSSFLAGGNTTCTANVTDRANASLEPTGTLAFSTSIAYLGTFSNGGACTLVAGSCTFQFGTTEEESGTMPIYAVYSGGPGFYPSSGRTEVIVSPPPDVGAGPNASYNVTFDETGLPTGCQWTVGFGGSNRSTSSSTISFPSANGTYDFAVSSLDGTSITPSGTVDVSGTNVFVPVSFAPLPNVSLTFLESGLPVGTPWSVTVATTPTAELSGNGTALTFSVPRGPLGYAIGAPTGYGVALLAGPTLPSQEAATVLGNTTLRVRFAPLEPVYFNESSVPAWRAYPGAVWSVDLTPRLPGGPAPQSNLTNGTSIRFLLPAGAVFRFALTGPGPEYRTVRPLGGFHVPTHALSRTVRFVLLTSVVIFRESGLPTATVWNVTLTNGTSPALSYPFVLSGSSAALRVRLPAGTYNYTVSANSLTPSPAAGSFTVTYPSAGTSYATVFA